MGNENHIDFGDKRRQCPGCVSTVILDDKKFKYL